MTDQNLITEFLSTPGMIIQHADRFEFLKNELGFTALYAVDHRHKKALCSLTFEKAVDKMMIEKYVPIYTYKTGYGLFMEFAQEIKEGADTGCDYIGDDSLLKYLTI